MTSESMFDSPRRVPSPAEALVIKPLQFDGTTSQTRGMHRLAAVSRLLVGSDNLWAGVLLAEPNTVSSVHHHGPQETVVYLAEGRATLRWGRRLEHESELEAGDFLFVPPYLPHQEINPSADKPALWIIVRSGPEAVVVDLTLGADGEYVTPDSGRARPRAPDATEPRSRWTSLTWLARSSIAAVIGVVFGALWPRHLVRAWLVLLPPALLVLIGVLDIVWTRHARTARHLAVLDTYAEREIARLRPRQDSYPGPQTRSEPAAAGDDAIAPIE